MNDIKLLHEYINKVLSEDLRSSPLISVNKTRIFLFEGNSTHPTKSLSFGLLLEQRRLGKISERKLLTLWEQSTKYELERMLAEGVLDYLKDAYEKAKKGAKSLGDKALAALEKASDFILEKSLQLMNLAEAGVEKAVQVASGFIEAIKDFKSEHPILFKIGAIIATTVIIFALMSILDSTEAQAAIKMKSGKPMSEEKYNAVRGALSKWADTNGSFEAQEMSMKAIKSLDTAYQAVDTESIRKVGGELNGLIQGSSKMVADLAKDASGGDKNALSLLQKFMKIGAKLKVS